MATSSFNGGLIGLTKDKEELLIILRIHPVFSLNIKPKRQNDGALGCLASMLSRNFYTCNRLISALQCPPPSPHSPTATCFKRQGNYLFVVHREVLKIGKIKNDFDIWERSGLTVVEREFLFGGPFK